MVCFFTHFAIRVASFLFLAIFVRNTLKFCNLYYSYCKTVGVVALVMETAGQRLRVLRQKRGLNLEDIGKILNCSAATVSRIENDKNKTMISIDYLNKLADFYNVDVSYIIKGYLYPREIQNESFSAEETTEEVEIRNLVRKLNSEQITDTIKYINYLLSQNKGH